MPLPTITDPSYLFTGVLVYELCALRYPYTAETLPALVMRIVGGKPSPLPKYVSPELRAASACLLQQVFL